MTTTATTQPDQRVPVDATMGVEEEFHIVDLATGMLVPESARLLARLDDTFTSELHRSTIESRTAVCTTLEELRDELVRTRTILVAAADAEGLAILAAGTAPLVDPVVQEVTDTERFRGLLENYQQLVREQLICSCQVHVGVPDADEAVAVMNRVRPWLGVLLALSTSSPYWEGRDTGYGSYRTQVWQRWPTAGVPGRYRDHAEYLRVSELLQSGGSVDAGMFYWDVRPVPRLGTVEFRVADACTTIDDVLLQAALDRALVRTARLAILDGVPERDIRDEVLRLATWRAARFGLDGELLDPQALGAVTTDRAVRKLLAHVRPALEDAGDWLFASTTVDRLLAVGNSSRRQRQVMDDTGDLREVVRMLARATRPDAESAGEGGVQAFAGTDGSTPVAGGTTSDHATSDKTSEPAPPPTVDDHFVQIIIDEAVSRGIEVEVLDDHHGELDLRHPDGRREVVRAALCERTSAVAAWRCQDKLTTRTVLTRHGLVIPAGRLATHDERDLAFLQEHGDVVVKPAEGQTGDGVTVGISTPDELRAAIDDALEHGPDVLVEQRVPGDDIRVVVIDGEVVAAARRTPAQVVGDGRRTVAELVEASSVPVPRDEVESAVADQDLNLDAVPDPDDDVALSAVANVHRGGSIHDVTDTLSDHLKRVSVAVTEAIGIPLAGVDLMVPDVTGTDYAVIEVNERPGLANHEPHPVVERYLDLLFP